MAAVNGLDGCSELFRGVPSSELKEGSSEKPLCEAHAGLESCNVL